MKHKNKIISGFLLLAFAFLSLSCQKQQAEPGNAQPAKIVKAQSPTEA